MTPLGYVPVGRIVDEADIVRPSIGALCTGTVHTVSSVDGKHIATASSSKVTVKPVILLKLAPGNFAETS